MVDTIRENYRIVYENSKAAAKRAGRNIDDITVIPVSKTRPVDYITASIEAGIVRFGENYAQELEDKYGELDKIGGLQPEWHYIGSLQRSNVRKIAPFVAMIHSCDSVKLAKEIDKRAKQNDRIIDCLIQVNTGKEDTKSGCMPAEIVELTGGVSEFENINLRGLMSIGTFSTDEKVYRGEFSILRESLEKVNAELNLNLKELSMGMSGDYEAAIEEGATMVRVGTNIFGSRD